MNPLYLDKYWTDNYKEHPELIQGLIKVYKDQTITKERIEANMKAALSRHACNVSDCLSTYRFEIDKEIWETPSVLFKDAGDYFDGKTLFSDTPQEFFRIHLPKGITDCSFISDSVNKPKILLQRGIDFEIIDSYIYLDISWKSSDWSRAGLNYVIYLLDCVAPTDYLQRLYSDALGIVLSSTEEHKQVINIFYDIMQQGFTDRLFKRLLCVITDTTYLYNDEIIKDIFKEGEYNIIVGSSGQVYMSKASPIVNVGDTALGDTLLFDNVSIYTKQDDIPFSKFPTLLLDSSLIGKEFKGGIQIDNVLYDAPGLREIIQSNKQGADALYALIDGRPIYLIGDVDSDNFEIELLVTDISEGVEYTIVTLQDLLPFKGLPDTVDAFRAYLTDMTKDTKSIMDILVSDSYDQVPRYINLFKQYQKHALNDNTLFLSLNLDSIPETVSYIKILSYFKKILPMHASLLSFFEKECNVTYDLTSIKDTVDCFYMVEVNDEYSDYKDKIQTITSI